MIRLVVLVFAWCATFGLCVLADEPKPAEPKKPQWQRMLTGDDAKEAEKLLQKVNDLCAKDDYPGAIEVAEELLALRTKLQGEDHYQTVDVKQDIAAYRKIAALPAEKRQEWRAALAGIQEANAIEAEGRYARALPLKRTFLKSCREVLGEEHPNTATCSISVAFNLNAQGKYTEAQPLYRKGLDIYRTALGEEHSNTAVGYNNLASNLSAQGKHAEAQPLFRKALDIRRNVLGEEHSDTAQSYNNMAYNLAAQGKPAEAHPLYRRALEIRRKVLGEEHPSTANSYNGLAANLSSQGHYAAAQPLLQRALDILRKTPGEEHPHTAGSYFNVALNLNAQGKHAEAQPLLQKALDIYRKVLGEEHPYTALSYNSVATNLSSQEKYTEAQPLFQKALDISRKVLGEEHPDTALSYNNMAFNLENQGKHTEAQPLFRKALDIRRKVLGEEHPDTALSCSGVAINLTAQGKHAEAQHLLQKALDISRKVLGEEHPYTAHGYLDLAVNLNFQGNYAESEPILERAIYSYESSRLAGASGLDRASLTNSNPRLLLAVLRQGRKPLESWRLVELSLARGLLDQQATQHDPALTAEERGEQNNQRKRIAGVQPQILALATKAKRTETETAALEALLEERRDAETRLATVAVAVSQREVAEPDAIRKALPNDAAVVFWVDVNSKTGVLQEHWVCAVRSTGDPKWERLPGTGPDGKWQTSDSGLPRKLRMALTRSAPQAEVASLAKQLHDQRIAPALKHLGGVKTLYVVPVNEMAGVPIELLAPDHTVSYVPSGTFLTRAKEKAPLTSQRMLALGDPIFTRPDDKPIAPKPLPPGGLLVTQVIPESAAAKARLQAGDVILKYGEVELKDLDSLRAAFVANEKAGSVPVTLWRETAEKPFVRDVAPGRLGVVLDKDPAPVALANRRKTDALLLALRGGGWKDLPGTRIETDRLRQMLGDQCTVLNDAAASEQRLDTLRKSGELAKFRYLHFATHGQGNAVQAFESALILAQDQLPKDALPTESEPFLDGQLSAREVLDFWKLDAELVTLSACETAVGKDGNGDGLLGFAQAFLHAGSRSVCLSLWKVDDTATALLMDRFYLNLFGKREGLAKPMGKAAALDEAKRWLRTLSGEEALTLTAKMTKGVARGTRGKDEVLNLGVPSADPKTPQAKDTKPFAHPKFWAAFVLIGDPN